MCGICAYIGFVPGYDKTLEGILMLQNRGYDSCGVSSISNSKFNTTKYASKEDVSGFYLVKNNSHDHHEATNIMMHNRWSTHGAKTDTNAHPHTSYDDK